MKGTKKKLLIFHSALAPYRLDYFNTFADFYDCTVVFLSRNNRNQNFDQHILLSKARFDFAFMDTKLVILGRDINWGYYKYIKKYKPDVVIGGEYGLPLIIPFIYLFISALKYKIYTICDDSIDIAFKCRGLRKLLRNFLLPRIDGVILLNEEVKKWYVSNFNLKHSPFVLPILRNETNFRLQLSNCLDISNKYIDNFNLKNKRVFLYIGRLNKVKNIDALIIAFDKTAKKNDILIIVGDGEERDSLIKLRSIVPKKDQIIFTGRFEGDDLLAWYNVAHIFVLPSKFEPFGAVINEALLAGCFIICSVYAGASALVNDFNGIIVDPNKVEDLEMGLIKAGNRILDTIKIPLSLLKPDLMTISSFVYLDLYKKL